MTLTKETMLSIPRGISLALSQHCTGMGDGDQIFFTFSCAVFLSRAYENIVTSNFSNPFWPWLLFWNAIEMLKLSHPSDRLNIKNWCYIFMKVHALFGHLSQNYQIHNYNTRNAQSFRLPLCRTNTRKFSIYFQGPNFYNSLTSDITSSPSSASFKRKLKEFLLSRY